MLLILLIEKDNFKNGVYDNLICFPRLVFTRMRIHPIVDDHNTCLCLSLNILKCIVSIDLKRVTILANSCIATINKGSYKLYSHRQRYMKKKGKPRS